MIRNDYKIAAIDGRNAYDLAVKIDDFEAALSHNYKVVEIIKISDNTINKVIVVYRKRGE